MIRHFARTAITALALLSCLKASAAPMCGKFDFANMSNKDIENIVLLDTWRAGQAPKVQCGLPGETFQICGACADTTDEKSMSVLRPMLANGGHVAWHASWHNLRRSADLLSQNDFVKAQSDGYVAQELKYDEFVRLHILGGELSGEDFLSMHRLMMKMVQVELTENGLPCFAPWKEIPAINDPAWPAPKTVDPSAKAEWELLQKQLKKLRNPALLKNITLNRLGQLIEPNLHQNLHHFYRGSPVCSRESKAQGYCDDLIPVETSPLNKHFWKLHGLIDDLIGDWLGAHEYEEISYQCAGRVRCYQWGAVWNYPANGHLLHASQNAAPGSKTELSVVK